MRTSSARTSQSSPTPTQVISAVQSAGHVSQPGIVAQHGPAVGRQGREQFGLGLGDVPPAAEAAEMGVADAGNHADLRPRQFGQRGDLARPARAQFQHGVIVGRLDRRHAQGDAEVVVEVLRAGRAAEPRLQHGMDHLPRRCVLPALPVTAITVPVHCRRRQRAQSFRARCVSSTRTIQRLTERIPRPLGAGT